MHSDEAVGYGDHKSGALRATSWLKNETSAKAAPALQQSRYGVRRELKSSGINNKRARRAISRCRAQTLPRWLHSWNMHLSSSSRCCEDGEYQILYEQYGKASMQVCSKPRATDARALWQNPPHITRPLLTPASYAPLGGLRPLKFALARWSWTTLLPSTHAHEYTGIDTTSLHT